jgi:ubiquinone/menaquinone biosynthesis C-methylase UbiE
MTSTNTTHPVYGTSYGGTAPENYERYFVPVIGRPFAEALVAEAALRSGERVLDVACGTGIVARLAAGVLQEIRRKQQEDRRYLSKSSSNNDSCPPAGSFSLPPAAGSVAGLDVNPGMLSVARASASAAGADIRWYETTAESIPLPDEAFDVVCCQLGLQFVADKAAALREMRRVLAAGGRILVSTPPPNPFFKTLEHALARHVGEQVAAFLGMVFSMNDPHAFEQLLHDAGFRDVTVRTDTKKLRLPPAREFLWQYVHCTPLTGMLSQFDPGQMAAFENAVVAEWQPWSDASGMSYEQGMIVATARK